MLLLASASPRRAALLAAAGIRFAALPVDIDETALTAETPEAHVRRLAEAKARAAAGPRPDATVLGADTVVVMEDRILGKPTDAAEAAAMLRALSGRAHEVLTGVAVVPPAAAGLPSAPGRGESLRPETPGHLTPPARTSSSVVVEVARTRVWFFPLSEGEISQYIATGEPMDKAGAYAIQGIASRFVERIDGSYSNVVGLPVALVYRILRELPGIWQAAAP